MGEGSHFATHSPILGIVSIFYYSHPSVFVVYHTVDLICISPLVKYPFKSFVCCIGYQLLNLKKKKCSKLSEQQTTMKLSHSF